MIHTVRGFGIVNNAEIDVSQELSCFFVTIFPMQYTERLMQRVDPLEKILMLGKIEGGRRRRRQRMR